MGSEMCIRDRLSAHHALATLNEVIAGGMISWVLEADLKNFFGSLSHDWAKAQPYVSARANAANTTSHNQ